jgi:GNAT superfamily N-acetyltransferase
VRPAGRGDLPGLVALVERCSPDTLYRRFHGAGGTPLRRELARVADPGPDHRSWVAVTGRCVRGTATLAWGRSGQVEVAFLVEDAWFRRGVGRALFRAVARAARRAGVPEVVAWVQADNDRAVRFLRDLAPGAQVRFVGGGELSVTIPVPSPLAPLASLASPPRPPVPAA